MKKLNVLLVDDEKFNNELLKHLLNSYFSFVGEITEVQTIEDAITVVEKETIDLVFLDVELENGTGFDFISKINNRTFEVIFITGHKDFAIKAFKHNAIDYILKPIDIEELIKATNKAHKKITSSVSQTGINTSPQIKDSLPIAFYDKIQLVSISDIVYLKSDGRYTEIYLTNEKKLVASKNIGEFEKLLDPELFFRIHNSFIIHVKHLGSISKIDGYYCVLKDGKTSLPISKRRQVLFNKFLRL